MSGKEKLLWSLRQQPKPDKPADPQRVAQARQRLLLHATHNSLKHVSKPQYQLKPVVRRWFALPAVGLAVLIILVISEFDIGNHSNPLGGSQPETALAHELNTAARAAKKQRRLTLRPGQYWYARSEEHAMATVADQPPYSYRETKYYEVWQQSDGIGRVRIRSLRDKEFYGPRDRRRWIAGGRPALANTPGETVSIPLDSKTIVQFGPRGLTYQQLLDLPTDAKALTERVRAAARTTEVPEAQEMFVIVGDLLRMSPISPDLAASLYHLAEQIKGVQLIGEVKDELGRRGVAIAKNFDNNATQRQLIFNTKTGRLLAEREVALKPLTYADVKKGTTISSTSYLEEGVVNKIGEHLSISK